MGRRRIEAVQLPEGVQIVRKPNRTYYYWAPGRGRKEPGERTPIPFEPADPRFWSLLHKLRGAFDAPGTWHRLIGAFKASPEWARLRPATQKDYASYLDRLIEQCGEKLVADMTRRDVYQLRDAMADTPVAANHMLSVMRTIIEWSIPREYRDDNPVVGVTRLAIDSGGAAPWPEEGYRFVLAHAPVDLARMALLGRATGQRAGDLVRMKPAHMEADGINVWIGKRREKKHFVPLTAEQVREIRSWSVGEMDYFLKSTRDKPYTATHLNSRWNRWRDSTEALAVQGLVMTIHGLKATAVADRRRQGASDGAVADELGMSVAMVHYYSRFADKAEMARASRDRREAATVFKMPGRSRAVAASSGDA